MGLVKRPEVLVEKIGIKNRKIALCWGVFDVLHEGHLEHFKQAKAMCEILIVGITCDSLVNKGPGRPRFSAETRAKMVAALECVDFVVIGGPLGACEMIDYFWPKFYVKGPDYKNKAEDITGGIYKEEDAIKKVGGELVFTTGKTESSSSLINNLFNTFTEEQNTVINRIKDLGGMNTVVEIFNEIDKQRVVVVGEPIVDTYVFCEPEGISSKSPTISARYTYEENYAGGSMAVANHLADFVKEIHLFAPYGKELYFQSIKKTQVDRRVIYHENMMPNYTTPRKTRYLESDKNQRMFELTNISNNLTISDEFIKIISSYSELGSTLLCDFGHGLFVRPWLLPGFVALNCQTNSSNFGFNPFTKHNDFQYLSIDLKEARVAFHDRTSDANTLFEKIGNKNINVSMTLGAAGALYRKGLDVYKSPAFADKVVDAIGAGDAYYAITSMLVKVKAPTEMIPFIGNIFAGLKTKIIGNKSSVTKADLFKSLTAILK